MAILTRKSDLVTVNGIRLHYMDWGGSGETLLFLTGMGSSAYDFERIAPRFTDAFHVLALTRRGQSASDHPETGYDLDTLTDDIRAFMDLQKIEKAILAGHSFGGVEITRFTERYPERVLKLVYLDAAYHAQGRFEVFEKSPLKEIQPPEAQQEFDSVEEYISYIRYLRPDLVKIWFEGWDEAIVHELVRTPQGKFIEKDTSSISSQMLDSAKGYDPARAQIKTPVLSFVAFSDPALPDYYTEEQKKIKSEYTREHWMPFQKREIALFKKNIPQAQVIEITDGHHYCFVSDEEIVYAAMRKFLQTAGD